jgi:hypothetical protein
MSPAVLAVGRRQDVHIRLLFILSCVAATAVLSSAAALWLLVDGVKTHFVTAGGAGYSKAGEPSDAFILGFAEDAALDRYTWSYVTIDRDHLRFEERLAPEALALFKEKIAPAERALVKKAGSEMVSGIAIVRADITARDRLARQVVLHGVRHLWVGGVILYDDIVITMTVAPLIKHGAPSAFRVTELSDDFPLNKPRR